MKRILMIIAALTLAVMMAACGSSAPAGSEPAADSTGGIDNAKDMFTASQEAMKDKKSMHVDMDFDMAMKMDMSGVEGIESAMGDTTFEIPIKMAMNMDVTEKFAKGKAEYKTNMFGADTEMVADMYVDIENGITYSKESDSEQWTKSEGEFNLQDVTMGMNETEQLTDEFLKDATFEETDSEYLVTLSAEAINSLGIMDAMNEMGVSQEDAPEYDITGGPIVYHFDKETNYMTAVEMNDIVMAFTIEEGGQSYKADIDLTATLKLSKIGEITDEDVAIPEDVINSASEEDDTVDVDLDELTDDAEEE